MKDNFSINSGGYAKYRPTYPAELFDYLNSLLPVREKAWDCGTGNGQVAFELAKTFKNVFATDISQSQINNAAKADNITYSVQPAEHTDFESHQFDLVIIAQAIHWFDFEKFYSEVRRTAKKGALICALGYGKIEISKDIDVLISDFYTNVIGEYWDAERRYIDENYQTIPFPFKEIQTPGFDNKLWWTFDHLVGYLNTWSAVRHFTKRNGYNPVDKIQSAIEVHWNIGEIKEVKFPLLLRLGRMH